MDLHRRDLFIGVMASWIAANAQAESNTLASKVYNFEKLPVQSDHGNEFRPVLDGKSFRGMPLEIHETTLAPGSMPHPAHHHAHVEMFLLREGKLEVTINGKATTMGPGSMAYIASNDEHGIHNVGDTPAKYFVIAIGSDKG
jgi:quercetin dioxygenase-like cupin family protein